MSTITFSGLATGLDTEEIITSLMEVESLPLDSLENDKEYFESQISSYDSFNTILNTLFDAVDELDSLEEFGSYSGELTGEDVVSVSAGSDAVVGTYEVQVLNLAQTQKDVSNEGVADVDDESLSGTLTIDGTEIVYEDVSLSQLVELVNEEDAGYTASLIDDGTEEGWRLVLTGNNANSSADILGTGSISIDTEVDGHTRDAALAHVQIDGIDVYSENNTISNGIGGVTLDLLESSSEDEISYVTIDTDTSEMTSKVNSFISAYNNMVSYVDSAAESGGSTYTDFTSVSRKMRSFISSQLSGEGNYSALASLGFNTDYETGELSIDSTTLSEALTDDFDSVVALFAGDDDNEGIFGRMYSYLEEQTDSTTGLYASRETSINNKVSRIEDSIERMEIRLEKREETLTNQFNALELLMSELNSSSDYLTSYFESDSSSS